MQEEAVVNSPIHPTHFVLSFPGIDIESELNIIKANNDLIKKIGKPRKITKMNKSSLLIIIDDSDQANKMQNINEIASQPIVIEPHRTLNSIKGTVYSEAMSQSTDEEILDQLKSQRVIKVERMKRRLGGQLVGTNRFILTFRGTYLPSLITVAEWQREIVEPYVPRPLRCNRCQRLGHTKKWCRLDEGIEHCSRCSSPGHRSVDCDSDPFCINCRGPHPPTSKECEQYKFRCEVLATQAKNHITRKEATELVSQTYRKPDQTYSSVVKKNISPNPVSLNSSTKSPPIPRDETTIISPIPSTSGISIAKQINKSKPNSDDVTQMDTYLPDDEDEVFKRQEAATPIVRDEPKRIPKAASIIADKSHTSGPNPRDKTNSSVRSSQIPKSKAQDQAKNTPTNRNTVPSKTSSDHADKFKSNQTLPKFGGGSLVHYNDSEDESTPNKPPGTSKRERPKDSPPKQSPKKTKVASNSQAQQSGNRYAPIPVIGSNNNQINPKRPPSNKFAPLQKPK